MAVSFGFIEKSGDVFYSSQITIDSAGKVIDVYRRVSPGCKESYANEQYCEGTVFHTFMFNGLKIAIGLCGDLWYDENIHEVRSLLPDIVFGLYIPTSTTMNGMNPSSINMLDKLAESAEKYYMLIHFV